MTYRAAASAIASPATAIASTPSMPRASHTPGAACDGYAMLRRIATAVVEQAVSNSTDRITSSGDGCALDRRVAEPSEPGFGRLGEQDELARPGRPRDLLGRSDEGPPDALPTPLGRDGDRAQQRRVAIGLDRRGADDFLVLDEDTAGGEGVRGAVERETRGHQQAFDGRPVRGCRPCRVHQQQPVPPQQPASASGSSRDAVRSISGAASVGLVALMMALIIPSVTVCDGVMETSVSPTAWRPSRNSEIDRAPAMQPAYEPRSARSSALSESSATMSLIPIRPPGRSTRAISAKTAGLSAARLTTQLLMTTSIDSAGSGIASMWPLRNSTLVAPASAALRLGEREHLVGHVDAERPAGRPDALRRQQDVDAAAGAEVEHALARDAGRRPPSGLPQPSEASTAASGSSSRSSAEYRLAPIVSGSLQQEAPWEARTAAVGVVLAHGLVDGLGGHRRLLLVPCADRVCCIDT